MSNGIPEVSLWRNAELDCTPTHYVRDEAKASAHTRAVAHAPTELHAAHSLRRAAPRPVWGDVPVTPAPGRQKHEVQETQVHPQLQTWIWGQPGLHEITSKCQELQLDSLDGILSLASGPQFQERQLFVVSAAQLVHGPTTPLSTAPASRYSHLLLLTKRTQKAARGSLGSTCIHHTFISEYPSEISNNIKKNNDCTTWSSRTSNFHFKKSTNLLKISISIHIYNTTY